jgi:hypothetical protein
MCGLKVRFSQSPERRGVYQYALRVEVVSASKIPTKIFVFHQMPAGADGNTFAEFDHVATPVDFQEIPEDAASETVPWYRTDKCSVWLRSVDDLKMAKQLFVDDIAELQRTFDILSSEDNFIDQTTVDFSGSVPSIPKDEKDGDAGDDNIRKEIDQIRSEIEGKIGNDAMCGVHLSTDTMPEIRKAIATIGKTLGANVAEEG